MVRSVDSTTLDIRHEYGMIADIICLVLPSKRVEAVRAFRWNSKYRECINAIPKGTQSMVLKTADSM